MGVEPTGRRFPDAPQALKARRVTGPYSLPNAIIGNHDNQIRSLEETQGKSVQEESQAQASRPRALSGPQRHRYSILNGGARIARFRFRPVLERIDLKGPADCISCQIRQPGSKVIEIASGKPSIF